MGNYYFDRENEKNPMWIIFTLQCKILLNYI